MGSDQAKQLKYIEKTTKNQAKYPLKSTILYQNDHFKEEASRHSRAKMECLSPFLHVKTDVSSIKSIDSRGPTAI